VRQREATKNLPDKEVCLSRREVLSHDLVVDKEVFRLI
jgi:hypothetical protein